MVLSVVCLCITGNSLYQLLSPNCCLQRAYERNRCRPKTSNSFMYVFTVGSWASVHLVFMVFIAVLLNAL